MNPLLLGNLISFVGCILMVLVGFLRRKQTIMTVQCFQFAIQGSANLILGGVSGAVSGVVSILRNLFFARFHVSVGVKLGFIALQAVLSAGALMNGLAEWLPLLAAALFTWFLDTKSDMTLKIVILITQVMWLIYDLSHSNYIAASFDVLTVCSNLVGMYLIRKTAGSQGTGGHFYILIPHSLIFSRRESRSSKVSGRFSTSRSSAEGW